MSNKENIRSVGNQRRAIFNTSSKSLSSQVVLALENLREISQSQKIQILDSAVYFHFKDDGFVHGRNIIGHERLLNYSLTDFSTTKVSSQLVNLSEVEDFDAFINNFKIFDLNNSYLKLLNKNDVVEVSFETFLTN